MKRYKYVGKERDEETGLYYYGARYYSAWLGRFVSVDPLAGKYLNLNPYCYVGNRPIVAVDRDGRDIYLVIGINTKLRGKEKLNKENIIKFLNRAVGGEKAKQILTEFAASDKKDIYFTFGQLPEGINKDGQKIWSEGKTYRIWSDNKLSNPKTPLGSLYTDEPTLVGDENFNNIEVDSTKENYYITLKDNIYGDVKVKGKTILDGAHVVIHEVGAHTKNKKEVNSEEYKNVLASIKR